MSRAILQLKRFSIPFRRTASTSNNDYTIALQVGSSCLIIVINSNWATSINAAKTLALVACVIYLLECVCVLICLLDSSILTSWLWSFADKAYSICNRDWEDFMMDKKYAKIVHLCTRYKYENGLYSILYNIYIKLHCLIDVVTEYYSNC